MPPYNPVEPENNQDNTKARLFVSLLVVVVGFMVYNGYTGYRSRIEKFWNELETASQQNPIGTPTKITPASQQSHGASSCEPKAVPGLIDVDFYVSQGAEEYMKQFAASIDPTATYYQRDDAIYGITGNNASSNKYTMVVPVGLESKALTIITGSSSVYSAQPQLSQCPLGSQDIKISN